MENISDVSKGFVYLNPVQNFVDKQWDRPPTLTELLEVTPKKSEKKRCKFQPLCVDKKRGCTHKSRIQPLNPDNGWTLSPTRDRAELGNHNLADSMGKISTFFFCGRHFLQQQHHPQKFSSPYMLHVWCICQRLVVFYGKLGRYDIPYMEHLGSTTQKGTLKFPRFFSRRSRPKQRAMNPSLSGLPRLENPSGHGRVIGNLRGTWVPA